MPKPSHEGKCSLCKGQFWRYGNNPWPLGRVEDRCCDECNANRVIPARLRLMRGEQLLDIVLDLGGEP